MSKIREMVNKIKIIHSKGAPGVLFKLPLSCNFIKSGEVLNPFLQRSLDWGLMEEKNLFSSMDCVLLHLHSCCSDAELLLDCCSAPSRKCPIEY